MKQIVVVLCFSISSHEGFMRILKFRYPFTRKYCPEAKLVLVGMKRDLRDDKDVNIRELSENNENLQRGRRTFIENQS